jgi:hypothetical protein
VDHVQIGPINGLKLALLAFLMAVVLTCVVVGGVVVVVLTRATDNRHFAERITDALVDSCEENGNPLREILIEEQEDALQNPHDPRIHELFPQAPIPLAEQIIREGNAQHRERIHRLRPVDCRAQYPPP